MESHNSLAFCGGLQKFTTSCLIPLSITAGVPLDCVHLKLKKDTNSAQQRHEEKDRSERDLTKRVHRAEHTAAIYT